MNTLLAKQDRTRLVFKIYLIFICVYVCFSKHISQACRCPGRPEEGVLYITCLQVTMEAGGGRWVPESLITDGFEPPVEGGR